MWHTPTMPRGHLSALQDMSLRLIAKLVGAENPDWKAREVNDKADWVQRSISNLKSSMVTWHGATPQVIWRPGVQMSMCVLHACQLPWPH